MSKLQITAMFVLLWTPFVTVVIGMLHKDNHIEVNKNAKMCLIDFNICCVIFLVAYTYQKAISSTIDMSQALGVIVLSMLYVCAVLPGILLLLPKKV